MLKLLRPLIALLGLALLTANTASALAAVPAEKPASGSIEAPQQRLGGNSFASSEGVRENLRGLYAGASDSPVAAEGAAELGEAASAAPDFVVTSDGTAIPIPKGATGPYPTNSPGFQFNGGAGGNGLADNVTDVRIMNPNAQNPGGYVNYGSAQSNGGWQSVNPYSGQSISPSNPWWHIPLNLGP